MTDGLLQALVSGALYGSLYGLMALGLTLVWGALRLLNLAHGALYLAGGFGAWTALAAAGLPALAAFPLAVAGAAALGLALQRLVVEPLLGRPGWDNASLVATLGAAIVIENGALLVFGPQVKQLPPLVDRPFALGGVAVSAHRLLVIAIAVACLALLGAFLRRSRHGLAIRAVAQQPDAARLCGVSPRRAFRLAMALAGALAGLAGVLLSSILYLSPTAGFQPMLSALVVTIFGGLGSVRGTVWAAYTIGLLEALVQVFVGPAWALPGLFLFMIAVLVVRPHGLFGAAEAERL
jgi:branched-chain amino acid transport system permease protein